MQNGRAARRHTSDRIVICGAGGFIGGHLVKYFAERWHHAIVAVDKKPLAEWYQVHEGVQNLCLDLQSFNNCQRVCENAVEVYNLAADMGGIGFIENFRVECMRSVLINTHLLEAAYNAGVGRFFFASSACVYNTDLQQTPEVIALKEDDAYPAKAERGYGWEKLYSEMMCQEYYHERKMQTFIARFHNSYGPHGTWEGGREKAPAAICRKVIEARKNCTGYIPIWGNGEQTRSFMYIDDNIEGIDKIMHCDKLVATPVNLGSTELVTINQLVDIAEELEGTKLERSYDLSKPQGVAGRNSDNTLLKQHLDWEPSTTLKDGLTKTHPWIREQYVAKYG